MSIRSKDFTTLLKVGRQDFLNILKQYPEDYEVFCNIKDSLLLNNEFTVIGLKCQNCNEVTHLT